MPFINLTKKGRIYALTAATSALVAYFTVVLDYFPFLGISLSLITIATLVFKFKEEKTTLTKVYFAITLLLALFIAVRTEASVIIINLLGIFYFGSLMAISKTERSPLRLVEAAFAPFFLLIKSLFTKSEFYLDYTKSVSASKKEGKTLEILLGVLISIVVLLIILPLLASANPIFQKLLINIGGTLNLENILNIFEIKSLFSLSLKLVLFFFLLLMLPKILTFMNREDFFLVIPIPSLNLFIPKLVTALVLVVFIITQLQFYFATDSTLVALGYSHSEYAREVFGQLSVVAIVVFLLIYNDRGIKEGNKVLSYLLLVLGIFLTFAAFKSDFDYSNKWGFTHKRLYGFAVASFIFGNFLLFLYDFKNNLKTNFFSKAGVIFTGLILIAINLANFDYLIYNFRKSTTGEGVDYYYLSALSSDSLSFKKQLGELENAPDEYRYTGNRILYKIEILQNKYKNFDLRTFNFLEYKQYLDVKDIDAKAYREEFLGPIPEVVRPNL